MRATEFRWVSIQKSFHGSSEIFNIRLRANSNGHDGAIFSPYAVRKNICYLHWPNAVNTWYGFKFKKSFPTWGAVLTVHLGIHKRYTSYDVVAETLSRTEMISSPINYDKIAAGQVDSNELKSPLGSLCSIKLVLYQTALATTSLYWDVSHSNVRPFRDAVLRRSRRGSSTRPWCWSSRSTSPYSGSVRCSTLQKRWTTM